ncbi:MAG: hypothetical protein NZ959_10560 [Armatimonadetes bacterium]|nr:hypothetical protein [Armatimonadota bacterium]MDW8122132.1 hypothetical protein [Armatimonadota bacterium]
MSDSVTLFLPAPIGGAFCDALMTQMAEDGFVEKVEAGGIGGVQTFVWTKDDKILSVSVSQDDQQWTLSFSAEGTDIEEVIVKTTLQACRQMMTAVAAQLPEESRKRLEANIERLT